METKQDDRNQSEKNESQVVKAKLKPPAIAIIVSSGIALAVSIFSLMLTKDVPNYQLDDSKRLLLAVLNTLFILFIPASAFSIYGAIQMMNAKKYAFAMTSAIITILSTFIVLPFGLLGIWALVVLLRPETKSAFLSTAERAVQ